MPLSSRQRRSLAEIERECSADPTLAALSELFTEPLSGPADPPEPTAAAAPARARPSTWVAAVLAVLGVAGAIVAGVLGLATVTSLGVAVVFGSVAVVLANLLRVDRAPAPRAQHPYSRL